MERAIQYALMGALIAMAIVGVMVTLAPTILQQFH